MTFISVIIPTYNRGDLLREALQSVSAQEYSDYEAIVVDDGSTEDIAAVAGEFGGRVKCLRQENRGPGAARNLGIAAAAGEYLAFLDSDDLWFPWTLRTYAEVIRERGGPSFIAGKPFRFYDRAEVIEAPEAEPAAAAFDDYVSSGDEWRWWGVSSFVVRAAELRAAGGFADAKINGEDADLALRLGVAPGFVQILSPSTFAYREHAGCVKANLDLSLRGMRAILEREKSCGYPGGSARSRERRRIITRHLRPLTLDCLREGRADDARSLYRASLSWHLRERRFRFLVGFTLRDLALRCGLRRTGDGPAAAPRAGGLSPAGEHP